MKTDPATLVIKRFGGIRPLASLLEVDPSAVAGWQRRQQVPGPRMKDLLALARARNVKLTAEELILGGKP